MQENPSRRLVVILHADVVGSTALVRLNETLAHERIRDTFLRFSDAIASHGGTPHEIRGDALVAEFSKASDAVGAALAFQATNATHNQELSDGLQPELRVGIAMGEVVVADSTVTGEGVVLAQRLEQLAAPGGVCIQGAVYDTIPKRLPFRYDNLGERRIKGFDEPVRVYSTSLVSGAASSETKPRTQSDSTSPHEIEPPSIAVLPFTNISGDPGQGHFSDGMTEEIITSLSKISGLLVIARHSTSVYKGKAIDVKQVGQEQGVRYVLEGSVRSSSNRLRITAQLVDAVTGHHVWAERYDRSLDDIFAVQDEITRCVTVELQVQLTEGEQARVWSGGTDNLEAWEKVVRAAGLLSNNIKEDALEARRLVKAALALDPKFVSAWTVLGWTYWQDVRQGWSQSQELSIEQALKAARAALELENENPDGLALLGCFRFVQKAFDEAVETMEKAVSLAPSHSWITAMSASILNYSGLPRDAIHRIKKAMRLSPIHPMWFLAILGNAYHLAGEHDIAIGTFKKAIDREPSSTLPRVGLTSTLSQVGREEEARSAGEELLRCEPGFSVTKWMKAHPFKNPAQAEQVRMNLLGAGLPE